MIQIVICDDEQNSRAYLKQLILKQTDFAEITELLSGAELLKLEKEIDVLFLDIDLKEERSGMEIAKILRNQDGRKQSILIFITGYKEFVFDAFDVDAFHYLVKPVAEEKFVKVFAKVCEQIKRREEANEKRIHIQNGSKHKVISANEIFYLESQNHKVFIHTKHGVYNDYAKISDLEEELKESFFRIHKGYLINLAYLDHYTKTEVVLQNGEVLPLSKYKYADFVKAYLRFME